MNEKQRTSLIVFSPFFSRPTIENADGAIQRFVSKNIYIYALLCMYRRLLYFVRDIFYYNETYGRRQGAAIWF